MRKIGATTVAALLGAMLLVGPAGTARPAREARAGLRPRIVEDHIRYGPKRRHQMARYSKRHYGARTWRLRRKRVVVLHFTAGSSYAGAWNTFNSNAPSRGELPGVCTHYIIGKNGRIRSVVPLRIRCRHAIGINHRSIGVEMVQETTGRGSHWAARQILKRRPQIRSAVRLVRLLQRRFHIRMRNVIGHAMSNNSPYFRDLRGWRNDHTDWLWPEVKRFRNRLRRP